MEIWDSVYISHRAVFVHKFLPHSCNFCTANRKLFMGNNLFENPQYLISKADAFTTELPELGFELTFSPTNLTSHNI